MTDQTEKKKEPWYIPARKKVVRGIQFGKTSIVWYDRKLRKLYSPNTAALTGTILVFLIALFLLFIPPYIGVSDDGSLSEIMLETGLGYRQDDVAYPSGAYTVRLYLHSTRQPDGFSTHQAVIRTAMWVDDMFTRDNLFDIRFLGVIYVTMYLPAVWLVMRGIAGRVHRASEATFLTVLSAFVLGDGTLISYMNSLYPEALWQILLTYLVGFCLALQYGKRGWSQTALLGIAITGCMLVFSERHLAPVGFVLALFCIRQIVMEKRTIQTQILAVSAAAVLLLFSMAAWNLGTTRFTETSKLHSMTNGVLLRSENPAQTLEEFGIDSRFETLADISCYADYPYTLAGNPEIRRDFLKNYTSGSILLYYMQHPLSYVGLLELGTGAAFRSARDYVGNYEASTGLPARARNPLFIMYNTFKSGTLPETIGFLLIISVIYLVMFRRKKGLQDRKKGITPQERQIALDTFFCCWLLGITDISVVILQSGTAELERYQLVYGACIDFMLLLFFAEILHRLNILSDEE